MSDRAEGGRAEASSPPRHAVLASGTLIGGRYRVDAVLGEGSHSVVYAARDESAADDAKGSKGAKSVALKVIHRHLTGDPQVCQRFAREAKILARLEGEHVVRMLDFVEDDGLLAIVIERVEGESLEERLAKGAPLPVDLAIEVSLQVCAALGAAHANGVVHRDLKTANVLLAPAAPAGAVRVKVVDFGLAKVLRGEASAGTSNLGLTEQGMVLGTADYMAPEQARGDEVDARADLYAAGVILYEMTVGAPPFSGRTPIRTMSAHLSEAPPSPRARRPSANIPEALEAVILRALAKSPSERFASARELAQAIAEARDAARARDASPAPASTAVSVAAAGPASIQSPPSAEEIATSDTDLHVVRPSFTNARTLRAEEIAAAARAELSSAPAVRVNVTPEPAAIAAPPATAVRIAPRRAAVPIDDEPTAVSGEPLPSRVRALWVIVAVVAATIGVAIGILFGTR